MDEPDDAFCSLLWQANGGRVNDRGRPIFDGHPVQARCHEPGDCDRCELMQGVLGNLVANGITVLWICASCTSEVCNEAEELGIDFRLPGYYSEGLCQRPKCHRATQWGEEGRYSALLQLLTIFSTTIP